LSKKIKLMAMITIIVASLSASAIMYISMPKCSNCGKKFCFGKCIITYDDTKQDKVNLPNGEKTNQKYTRLAETSKVDKSYLKNVVFIGDSRTVALGLHQELDDEHIFAEEGLNHEGAMYKKVVKLQEYKKITIAEAVSIYAPSIMVVNFGVNGIAWMNPDEFMVSYEAFIDELRVKSPHSIVVIEAILPVSLRFGQSQSGATNEEIDAMNERIYEMAKRKGLYYLATDEVMKNQSNCLDAQYDSGDGLHFNKEAYEVIMDYILRHAIVKN